MKKIGIDIETSGLEFDALIAGVSIYDPDTQKAEYFPIHMQGMSATQKSDSCAKIREYLTTCSLVGHNLMFDLIHLRRLFPDVSFTVAGDSLIIAHMAQLKSGKLKDLVLSYGIARNEEVVQLSEVADGYDFTQIHITDQQAIRYACNDAEWAFKLEKLLAQRYEKSLKLYSLELRVLPVFVDMSVAGMRLDWEEFQVFINNYCLRVQALKQELDNEAGFSFATRSRRDMESIIVDKFGLHPTVRTAKGEYSYSLDSLKSLDHPWVQKYLTYSHMFSTQNTMLKIDKFVFGTVGDFWVHPTYLQVGFDGTSRVYTRDPSTNQLPKEFRDYVKPSAGKKFLYMDWSAAELAVAIFWSRETTLLETYRQGADLHRLIASELLEKPYEQVSDEDREVSKIVTFSIMYGSEGGAASRALGISFDEASRLVQKFWEKFPRMLELRTRIQTQARRTFRTWTAAGRCRRLSNIETGVDENKGLRQAFNTAIQSSVADFQKLALIRLHKYLQPIGGRVVTTVFDSFLIEVAMDVDESQIGEDLVRLFTFELDGFEWKFNFKLKSGYTWGTF